MSAVNLVDAPVEEQYYALLQVCVNKAAQYGLTPLYIECREFEIERFVISPDGDGFSVGQRRGKPSHVEGIPTVFKSDGITPRIICKDYYVLTPYYGMNTSHEWDERELKVNFNGSLKFDITQELR